MKMRRLIVVAGMSSLVGCTVAHAAPTTRLAAAGCNDLSAADRELATSEALQRVDRVEPYQQRDLRTRATQQLTYTAGARLYVPAQQGWNAPYLERVLSCHAVSGAQAHANDPLAIEGIADIDVSPRGGRFLITIAGATREAGRQIWQRAEALQSGAQIEVRQISQESSTPKL